MRSYAEMLEQLARDVENMGLDTDLRRWREEEILTMREFYLRTYASKTTAKKFVVLNNLLIFCGNSIIPSMRLHRKLRLPPPERGRVSWQTPEERSLLLETSDGTLRMVLLLGYGLGLRRAEMAQLKLSDIKGGTVRVLGKGSKTRDLPLEGLLADEIRKYVNGKRKDLVNAVRMKHPSVVEPETLLLHAKGSRLSGYAPISLRDMIHHHVAKHGIQLTTHDMRRTFGRALHLRGIPTRVIMQLFGHKDEATTILYLGLDLDDMRSALREMYTDICTLET
jgi:integrase